MLYYFLCCILTSFVFSQGIPLSSAGISGCALNFLHLTWDAFQLAEKREENVKLTVECNLLHPKPWQAFLHALVKTCQLKASTPQGLMHCQERKEDQTSTCTQGFTACVAQCAIPTFELCAAACLQDESNCLNMCNNDYLTCVTPPVGQPPLVDRAECKKLLRTCREQCRLASVSCGLDCDANTADVCLVMCGATFQICLDQCDRDTNQCINRCRQRRSQLPTDCELECQSDRRQCQLTCDELNTQCLAECPVGATPFQNAEFDYGVCISNCEDEFQTCLNGCECSMTCEVACYQQRRLCRQTCEARLSETVAFAGSYTAGACSAMCREQHQDCLNECTVKYDLCAAQAVGQQAVLACDLDRRVCNRGCEDSLSGCCDQCPTRCG
ncbi:uncharacterized protein MONOS_8563 [Monocercomonoides exilis]|uniref:uncharacterized protein n=1 Tax=Monocercomonoides exilis TaxID=2049356 RepID=UPI0035598BA1|nr:hypothetical protein MONOS_8563 [Monocercomonoides exilis]|eukprot:MONOS_8563.1-p1 / transcript=MONOS_8563.1 / gene=MONOS_8563 / organism=Monocercomonoides_exilis_PA203 / gene_product=unspecified product / transcript_product=unspecified product / location=Mono_scaffold00326:26881-28658(-) / protein_length=385 / sequence_SO=supercontig / SO=protein_coding / is_pseudo=false